MLGKLGKSKSRSFICTLSAESLPVFPSSILLFFSLHLSISLHLSSARVFLNYEKFPVILLFWKMIIGKKDSRAHSIYSVHNIYICFASLSLFFLPSPPFFKIKNSCLCLSWFSVIYGRNFLVAMGHYIPFVLSSIGITYRAMSKVHFDGQYFKESDFESWFW